MQLQLILQICVASLTALGTLLMGLGERSAFLPIVAVIVAVSSVYVTDYLKLFRLNVAVANLAGISAVVFSLVNDVGLTYQGGAFKIYSSDTWLMAVAHLLTYLQFILLFQEKNDRGYWLLLTLSLLQVAVAAALSLEVWFGMLLTVYLFLALVTMSLFFMIRETRNFEQFHETPSRAPRTNWVRPRWPLSTRRTLWQSQVQTDPAYAAVTWLFLRRVGGMVTVTLLLTAAVFFLVPRTGHGGSTAWNQPRGRPLNMVGFAEEVEINQLGDLLESPEKVLQLRFQDPETLESVQLTDEPRLRGSVLIEYNNGRWSKYTFVRNPRRILSHPPPPDVPVVREIIDLEPMDSEVLFGIYPWATDAPRSDVRIHRKNLTLERPASLKSRRIHYELLTWGIEGNRQLKRLPHYGDLRRAESSRQDTLDPDVLDMLSWYRLTRVPTLEQQPTLKHVQRLADEVAPGESYTYQDYTSLLPPDDVIRRARRLESHLRDSGEYHYTLKLRRVDYKLDPVEDFLVNRKEGHCEYFASALVLLLRSKGIPARMISGFKGGEWNSIGQFYQVRQYHAHTWVEAYLPPEPDQLEAGGSWLVLDPTPGEERADIVSQQQGSNLAGLRGVFDYAQYLWSGYVLGMDSDRQEETVYKPIADGASDLVRWLFDVEAWKQMFTQTWKNLQTFNFSYFRGTWFNWRGGLVAIVLCWIMVGIWRFTSWVIARQRGRRRQHDDAEAARGQQVEFYRRLKALLRRHQMERGSTQTPREFAVAAGGRLADEPQHVPAASLPRKVVEAFYRVRFGGHVLDKQETEAVEQALLELESVLEPPVSTP